MDKALVAKLSIEQCPVGTSFEIDNTLVEIGPDPFPAITLFTLSKGTSRCTLVNNYNQGGLFSWLSVSFEGNCLENGSIWSKTFETTYDGEKVILEFTRVDSAKKEKIEVHTRYGRPFHDLTNLFGLKKMACKVN